MHLLKGSSVGAKRTAWGENLSRVGRDHFRGGRAVRSDRFPTFLFPEETSPAAADHHE